MSRLSIDARRVLPALLMLLLVPPTSSAQPAVEAAGDAEWRVAFTESPDGALPGDTLALAHVHVVPMSRDTVLRDRTLVIADGEILSLRPDTVPPPAGAEIRDLGGAWVLPGLIDAHAHLREPPASLALFPAAGVTTVMNLEGEPAHLALRDSVLRAGSFAPRILSSGPFLDERAGTEKEARAEVRRQHAAGYDLVKIHGEIEERAFLGAIEEATLLGLPVVGHHPNNLPTATVLDGGLSALAHAEELLGSSLLEEPAALSSDSVDAIARRVVESGTGLISTLAFFTGMRDQATRRFYEMIARPELAYVSPRRRQAWLYDGHREYIDPSELGWYDDAVDILHRITGAIHDRGGTVIAGTDSPLEFTVPGFSLREELERLVSAGLSPSEALRAATVAPAGLVGREDLGRIKVGAAADLLVLRENPASSLEALDRRLGIVLRGTWYPEETIRRRLDDLVARYARDEVTRAARQRILDDMVRRVTVDGTETVARDVEWFRENPGTPELTEGDLNTLGYRLLRSGEVETAIEIFRLNARLHPSSANVYDSLGEAYLEADDLERARENYRRALKMNPGLDSARRGLREIYERGGGG